MSNRYVVRGKDSDGVPAVYIGDGGFAEAYDNAPALVAVLSQAIDAAAGMRLGDCTAVRIFAVSPDGTETPLPTYEEALAKLAALRVEVEKAIAYREPGQKAGVPRLATCPPGALQHLMSILGASQ